MNIAIVDAFYDISHRQWAEGWKRHSSHEIEIYSLPPRHWKWQMTGGSLALAQLVNASDQIYDVIVVTDMVHLGFFFSLLSPKHQASRMMIYFHENQITYPWSPEDQDVQLERDHHYGLMNYASALAAEKLFFNSHYHQSSFLGALPRFINQFPDIGLHPTIKSITEKSSVLPIGMELNDVEHTKSHLPIFLWNHRWEYDKNPDAFFELLFDLKEEGYRFQVIVAGKSYARQPKIFSDAKERLRDEILHYGYAASKAEYQGLLSKANILVVTGYQDFFGMSVVEAIHAGCYPLLPDRLAYPEHIPYDLRSKYMYQSDKELALKVRDIVSNESFKEDSGCREHIQRYSWGQIVATYDEAVKL